jgi:hypothetical protein
MTFDRQMREEGFNLFAAHVGGVALAMKEDVTFDPFDVGLFGAGRVVLEA